MFEFPNLKGEIVQILLL